MLLDLNAARSARAAKREGQGDAVSVPFGEATFTLPIELPLPVVDKLLDPEVEFAQMLMVAVKAWVDGGATDDNTGEAIAEALAARPDLPLGFVRAVLSAIEMLFGADQWTRFQNLGPSVQDMFALVSGLIRVYGVGLEKAFESFAPSTDAGTTSSATSNASTGSTPEVSGPTPKRKTTLASAV